MTKLEFELEKVTLTSGLIQYNVLRKGLNVGIMVLEEPYNLEKAECNFMEMENIKWVKNGGKNFEKQKEKESN